MMTRFEKVELLKAPIVQAGTDHGLTGGPACASSSNHPIRVKTKPHVFPMSLVHGTYIARLFARLHPVDLFNPLTSGGGSFPRSRHEIKGGARRGLN